MPRFSPKRPASIEIKAAWYDSLPEESYGQSVLIIGSGMLLGKFYEENCRLRQGSTTYRADLGNPGIRRIEQNAKGMEGLDFLDSFDAAC